MIGSEGPTGKHKARSLAVHRDLSRNVGEDQGIRISLEAQAIRLTNLYRISEKMYQIDF